MDPSSFLPRLQELRARLQQGRQLGTFDPEVAQHFQALTSDLKAAVQQAHAEAHAQGRALGQQLAAKAEELRKKLEAAKNPPPPAPTPDPWEDHQGLGHERIQEVVNSLLSAAAARPGGR